MKPSPITDLLERWDQQTKMFEAFAEECRREDKNVDTIEPEVIKMKDYYAAIADRIDHCARELRAII